MIAVSQIDYERVFRDFLRNSILKDTDGLESLINNKRLCFALYKDTKCMYANKSIAEIFALSLQDFLKFQLEEFHRFVFKEDSEKIRKTFEEFQRTRQDKTLIIRIIAANGIEKTILLMFLEIFLNKEPYLLILIINLTDAIKNDQIISLYFNTKQELSANFNFFMEILPVGAVTDDLDYHLIYMNKGFQNMVGFDSTQFINFEDWLVPLIPDEIYRKEIKKVLESKNEPIDVKIVDKWGKERIVEWTCHRIQNTDRRIHFIKDVTEQKKREYDVLTEKKLESLSLLTGGIAHDYNNILFGIMGNLDMFDGENLSKEGKKAVQYIRVAADRAKKLTRQLLTFAKGGDPVKKPTTFDEILESAIDFVSYSTRCKIITKYFNKNIIAHVDSDQIHQVITNLLMNAVQANENKGKVIISIKVVESGFKMTIPSGKYIEVTIEDEGSGIPAEMTQRIFDPYFTTKKDGHGLGLAIVFSIIKKHYGYVGFEPNTPRGTRFFFYLPYYKELNELKEEIHKLENKEAVNSRIGPPIESTREFESKTPKPPQIMIESNKPYIIVMDDEEVVRDVLKRMVMKLGFESLETKEGQEAFDNYKKLKGAGKPIAAMIIDLTIMEGMSGIDLIRLIREVDKKVPCIVSSGYFDDPILSKYEENGFNDVLLKPYTIKNLRESLQKLNIIK